MGPDWQRPPVPAQLQLRVAILGGIALVIFLVVFLRLWYLQVLSGESYRAEAQNNQVREFTVRAPRGLILDRDGEELVTNKTALELQVNEAELPDSPQRRRALFRRLAPLADMSPKKIRKEIRRQLKEVPGSPVSLKRDVSFETVYFLRENAEKFPGVSVERVFVRQYPHGQLAAHLLGSVGEVDPEELDEPRYETLEPGDYVGKSGVEYSYDALLRGVNGATRTQVDANGTPTGRVLAEREPRPGNNLVLSIDADVQQAAQSALSEFGLPGGFVAMNVRNGELLALGSTPSYDPSLLSRASIPPSVARQIYGDPDDPLSTVAAPAFNRATNGGYPTGSTFKPITALAALDSGKLGLDEIINDSGEYDPGDGNILRNAGNVAHGPLDLEDALKVSSDIFFYVLGARTNQGGDGGPIQEWARALGLGEPTGIDVGGETSGRVPTPEERDRAFRANTDPDGPCGEEVCIEKGELTDRPWSVGDNINLAVGQGDLQASPLQLAVAYAAIANGGSIVRPHVGWQVRDPAGRLVQEIAPAVRRQVEIDPAWRRAVLEGLRRAAMEPGGTSYPIFGGYPVEIAGKTGTAERPPHADQAWYVAIAPFDNPKYVVAVTVEEGGFGAETAAPVAREILNKLLKVKESKIEQVSEAGAAVAE